MAGLLASALLLHLNVARPDFGCGRHASPGSDERVAPDVHAMHMSAEASGAPTASAPEQCEAPVQADCCSTVASCAIVFAVPSTNAAAGVAPPAALGTAAMVDASPGDAMPPDPPPPRA